jgi:uncharacterized membrane protein
MSKDYFWTLLLISVIFGFVGRYISTQKNRSRTEGFVFGFFLSIFGLIIISLLPSKEYFNSTNISEESNSTENQNYKKRKIDRNKILLILLFIIILITFFYTGFVRGDFKL